MLGWKPQFQNPDVAGVRYRCLNPLNELLSRGFPVELFRTKNAASYCGVIFSKAHDEDSYRLATDLKRANKAVIFDICDNHFYNPHNLEKFRYVRWRLLRMLSLADLVTTSTETLADVIKEEARLEARPTIIGDAVEEPDTALSKNWFARNMAEMRLRRLRDNPKRNIMWYGIHGGENAPYGMLDLLNVADVLTKLSQEYPLRLIVVSNSKKKYKKYIEPFPFETCYFEWGTVPLGRVFECADINVIPITKNPFTICKSNNRLALALYAGVPTVADEIPSYRDLASFCILNEWQEGLRFYLGNATLARAQAREARAYIQARYMIHHIADQWMAVLSPFIALASAAPGSFAADAWSNKAPLAAADR